MSTTPLSKVRPLTSDDVARLAQRGIRTAEELFTAVPTQTSELKLGKELGIDRDRLRSAVDVADLIRVKGIGAALGDLFDHAGIHGAKALARRVPLNLAPVLAETSAQHPLLTQRPPNLAVTTALVAQAKALGGLQNPSQATPAVMAAMTRYVDAVLFSNHPDGEAFRAMLSGHEATEQERLNQEVRGQLLADVPAFVGQGQAPNGRTQPEELIEQPNAYVFVGRWLQIYTEVSVSKATGQVTRIHFEVD
jgi:hypothetical protein